MWEFKTLEMKQAMKYIGSGECLEEVLVPYCGQLIVKISPAIHLLLGGFSKFFPLSGGLYLTTMEDALAL